MKTMFLGTGSERKVKKLFHNIHTAYQTILFWMDILKFREESVSFISY